MLVLGVSCEVIVGRNERAVSRKCACGLSTLFISLHTDTQLDISTYGPLQTYPDKRG